MKKLLIFFTVVFALTACGNEATQNIDDTSEPDSATEISSPFETIDLDDIEDYVAEGYIVADVREVDEFESGHIPNALNAPLSELENGELGPLDENEKYVIICRSGNRSAVASNILSQLGFDIVNVSEGMSTWTGDVNQ